MKPEMRQQLAREPFAEKIRKVEKLLRLARTFPRKSSAGRAGAPSHSFVRDEDLAKKDAHAL
jgi:hypothetical protein